MTGWMLFISKIEICVAMVLGAFSAITGKLRKLAATVLIFEVLTNIVTFVAGLIICRKQHDSWSETWKYWKDTLSKPFGPEDHSEYIEALEWKEAEIRVLKEEYDSLQEKYDVCKGLKKPGRKKTTKKKEEDLNKVFDV